MAGLRSTAVQASPWRTNTFWLVASHGLPARSTAIACGKSSAASASTDTGSLVHALPSKWSIALKVALQICPSAATA
ncbi:hypothetical protein OV079_42975 [Nannocystis pusilla]|uniref:Uncharacterized protein n=1 Tax=Nannocystis pusilla TaxID=889268 RepID=A0A9X3J3K5_9BACT|nr:hypothetical protein [Nannocystis pusilla]MCY1012193.1 hypothetical protein [Nannocystis pusilla]